MNIPSAYSQLDQWKSIMFLYDSALKEINTKIEILNGEFVHIYGHTPIEHIKSRLKTPESIVKKLKLDGQEVTIDNMVEKLSDIAGIRIICSFTQDIYQIADMIARQKDVSVLYVKDYIKQPKPNGYKSYHMVVTIPIYLANGPVDTKVEIQIRTAVSYTHLDVYKRQVITRLLLGLPLSMCVVPFVETAVLLVLFPDVAGNTPDPALPQDGRVIAVILQNLPGKFPFLVF